MDEEKEDEDRLLGQGDADDQRLYRQVEVHLPRRGIVGEAQKDERKGRQQPQQWTAFLPRLPLQHNHNQQDADQSQHRNREQGSFPFGQ